VCENHIEVKRKEMFYIFPDVHKYLVNLQVVIIMDFNVNSTSQKANAFLYTISNTLDILAMI
jgi:hypothetical protein